MEQYLKGEDNGGQLMVMGGIILSMGFQLPETISNYLTVLHEYTSQINKGRITIHLEMFGSIKKINTKAVVS